MPVTSTPTQKLRWLNSRRSTTGWASVSSQAMNTARPTTATTPSTTISVLSNQSASGPRSSTSCMAPTPSTSRARPMVSIGRRRVGVSRVRYRLQPTAAASRPTGRLMKKIQGQLRLSVSQPPSSGPTTGATSVVMPQKASARPAWARG